MGADANTHSQTLVGTQESLETAGKKTVGVRGSKGTTRTCSMGSINQC